MAWEPKPEHGGLFRPLSDEEEEQFRQHARENDPPTDTPWSILHPVCVEEWQKRDCAPEE